MPIVAGTKVRALQAAKGLLQRVGFSGLTFQSLADLIGIKKPSLYDHFVSKEALGCDLLDEYYLGFSAWTETIEIFGPREKVGALFERFFNFASQGGKFCPLSALIADYHALPKKMKRPLAKLYRFEHEWLKKVIEEGQKKKVFSRSSSGEALARLVLALGLGAQMLARVSEDPEVLRKTKEQVFQLLERA